jgi:hypothetical protein
MTSVKSKKMGGGGGMWKSANEMLLLLNNILTFLAIITCSESEVRYSDLELEQKSSVGKHKDLSPPKKFYTGSSSAELIVDTKALYFSTGYFESR